MSFLLENEIYDLLQAAGFLIPKFQIIRDDSADSIEAQTNLFQAGQEVVIKGLAPELWHKSDVGLVQFLSYDAKSVRTKIQNMKVGLPSQYKWAHALVLEKVSFKKNSALPSEIFFALKQDEACGWILLWGIGGVHSELWAKQIPPLSIPLEFFSEAEIFEKIQTHFITQVLLGQIRGGPALTTLEELQSLVKKIYKLIPLLNKKSIQLLEVNPLVVNGDGKLIPLDGVGSSEEKISAHSAPTELSLNKLFHPKSIGIIGVSKRANSPTNIIYENARSSNAEVFAVQDYKELQLNPVELLIVGINAKNTYELCENLLLQGGGAEYLYLVAGGILDGSDHEGYGKKILLSLKKYRQAGRWTPNLIGPNGLGLLSSPLKLNTMFIPEDKLRIKFNEKSSLALVSQSGAFLITRFSLFSELHPKYAISIGSKMDLKVSDFIDLFEQDATLNTVGLYLEGFDANEAILVAQKMKTSKKKFIIYKAGRSPQAAQAAQSHTGAMMTEYGLVQELFDLPNVSLCKSFSEWSVKLKWLKKYPNFIKNKAWGLITNAGYEAVGSADFVRLEQYKLTQAEFQNVQKNIEQHQLQSLVTAANPLDLTPMASEEAWLDCVESFFETSIQTLLLGIVPLTPRLNTTDKDKIFIFGQKISALSEKHGKPVGIIIDSGAHYDLYRETLKSSGLFIFSSIEEAALVF